MAEGAPLLREYGLKAHRGFESLSLRHNIKWGRQPPIYIVLSVEALMRTLWFDKFVWNELIRHFLVTHLSGHYATHNVQNMFLTVL